MATPSEGAAPGAWVNLKPADQAAGVGCLFVLAAVLLLVGGGAITLFFVDPAGKGDPLVLLVVGGAFFLVGAVLLYGGVRGARGRSIAPPELAIQGGPSLRAGTTVALRLRQRGPVTLESLKLTVVCRREYRRKVKAGSSSTVPDHEILWERVLLDVLDEQVPTGGVLEREVSLALPADASPTGAAQPAGQVRWQLEVAAEAGFMRAAHRAFTIGVGGAHAGAPASANWSPLFERDPPEAAEGVAGRPAPETRRGRPQEGRRGGPDGLSFNAGCLVIGVVFVFCGGFFLWAFFSGVAESGRGNPYMALFGGLLFGGTGLVAVVGGVLSIIGSRKRRKAR